MTEISVRQVLERTLERLHEKGWLKGTGGGGQGPNCIVGALHISTKELSLDRWNDFYWDARQYLVDASCLGDEEHISLAQWNDAPERTFEDVVEVLKKAIVEAPL